MGKQLTIVVPHYKEPFEICHHLFDSIAIQRGIEFDDISVLVVNDGDDVVWDMSVFEPYPYDVEYVVNEHKGISETRNFGIEHGDSEYIMFCDCDDMFLNNYALHLLFGAMQEGFNFLHSVFIEEQRDADSGAWTIIRRDRDLVFVHGKCYRREFLKEKELRFDPELRLNEDSVFNKIAYHEAGDFVKYIETPFYLWCWNGESTVRKEREDFVLKTYDQVMLMRQKVCEQLEERGFIDEYFNSVCQTVFDSYYDFNEPSFTKKQNRMLRLDAEKAFKRYYRQFSKSFMECDSDRIGTQMMQARLRAYNAGMRVEEIDFKSWIKHIKNDVKA